MIALGWIVIVCGMIGFCFAFTLMWWTNGLDYPLVIGGKPGFSIPSMVPILFESTVLLSSFGAVFGMFGLNQLPQHHHPAFYSDRFDRHSDDRFFVSKILIDIFFYNIVIINEMIGFSLTIKG